MGVELDWLQTFVIAAQEENFRKTAEQLHVAQPTVTMHIQKLEQTLGLFLFERSGRGVRLNAAGKQFLRHAKSTLNEYHRGRDELIRWQQGYEEVITIAASPLVATTILPESIRRFSRLHPTVEFSIQIYGSQDILQHLLRHDCDIGLTRFEIRNAQAECTRLYSDPIVMVAPADAQDVDGPALDPGELLNRQPVLTHNHPEYWDALVVALRRLFPEMRTMKVSQVHVAIHWIAEKLGVSFLPASTVRRELMRGNILEVPFPYFTLPITHTYMLTDPTVTSGIAYDFADYLQIYMQERSF